MNYRMLAACLLAGAALMGLPAAFGAPYVRVEVRGTLNTGIMAIGGETTGTIISAGDVVWELEIPPESELAHGLETLNGAEVIVTGRYREKRGVEVPLRHIVTVDALDVPTD